MSVKKIVGEGSVVSLEDIYAATPLLHNGYPREVWIGTYVGGITFICQHLIFSFLMFSATIWTIVIFYAIPIPILIWIIHRARKAIIATEPTMPELKGSWNLLWLIFCGFLVYQSYLWGVQSIVKQAIGLTPTCYYKPTAPFNDDAPKAIWFPRNNYQSFYEQSCTWHANKGKFYAHALVGPFILMLGCFNFMKFSRGLVFDINYHRWVGRIHNILLLFAGCAAIVLANITATPFFIAIGFYILAALWIPTMLLGWYFIKVGNIKQHKRWMTRNFTCTVGAITLRLYNLLSGGQTPYWLMVWLTMAHLPVVEFYLQYSDDGDRIWILENLFGYPQSPKSGTIKSHQKGVEGGISMNPIITPL